MKNLLGIALCIFAILIAGCSSSGNLVAPDRPTEVTNSRNGHGLMGLWQVEVDAGKQVINAVPLRLGEMHLNVLPFLEPPAMLNLTVESLQFNGNFLNAEIGLKHPFIGLNQFTGFDVCGIMVLSGSKSGFENAALRTQQAGDTRLLNADGYSRWWNPVDFDFIDGLLGTPDAVANFNSTLNPYKYYCDDLGSDDPLSMVTSANRGKFGAGNKNIRRYSIELGSQNLVFNYAVDASWTFPNGSAPWDVPGDFPPAANRPEAWNVVVNEVENTLWNDGSSSGGELSLSMDVYDRYDIAQDTVKVESPGNFNSAVAATPIGGGVDYSTYQVEIIDATPAAGTIDVLIQVGSGTSGYGGSLPGQEVNAFFIYTVDVSPEPPLIIYVDDSNTSGIEDGTKPHPYNTIQEGIDNAPTGYTVLVDDSGTPYAEHVNMKTGAYVKSSNWDASDGANRAIIDGPADPETYSVVFDAANNATLEGFEIWFAGPIQTVRSKMMNINASNGVTVKDCWFTGNTDYRIITIIEALTCSDLTITNCRISDIDKATADNAITFFSAIYAKSCPGVVISNNIIADIRSTPDASMKNIDSIKVELSDNAIVKNNLVHDLAPQAPGNSNMQKVFYFISSQNATVMNNTVDVIDVSVAFMINQDFAYWFEYCGDVNFSNNIATRIYSSGWPPPLARGVCAYYNSYVLADFTDTWDIGPGSNGANYHSGGGGTSDPGVGAIDADPQYNDPANEDHDFPLASPAQQGNPTFVDWDDTGSPSGNPADTDTNTRSRMGCFGGPDGEFVGLIS